MKNNPPRTNMASMPEVNLPGRFGRLLQKIPRVRPAVWFVLFVPLLVVVIFALPCSFWCPILAGVWAQKYLLGMSLVFCLIALSLVWSAGQRVDAWVFTLINRRGRRPAWLDWAMLCFTQIGNGIFAYSVAFILILHGLRLLAYELIFGILTLWLAVELMKALIRRPRPYSGVPGARVVGDRAGGHSFPSGHTSQVFFMASLFSHYFNPLGEGIIFLFYAVALLVGVTRMYVGMHYPRDVLGGAILGTAWGLVGVFINSYIFAELHIH